MGKQDFLRNEYKRILASGEFVWSAWRDSYERFQSDLWDMTPTATRSRHLAPRDGELGFSPDNIEWHFRKIRKLPKPRMVGKPSAKTKLPKEPRLTTAEKRHLAALEKEERRRKLAEEFIRWEEMRETPLGLRKLG